MTQQTPSSLTRGGGLALIMGGALMAAVNAGLTPFLPIDVPFAELAASSVFAWRQSLAIVTAFLLVLGSAGLYAHYSRQVGWAGGVAFVCAFAGSAFLLAHEWNQVFFVRDLALRVPEGLEALENAPGMTLFDISAMIALVTFSVGWIAFAAVILAKRVATRLGAALVIAGFFVVPLGAALSPVVGQIAGNLVLGAGWILLGRDLWTTRATGVPR